MKKNELTRKSPFGNYHDNNCFRQGIIIKNWVKPVKDEKEIRYLISLIKMLINFYKGKLVEKPDNLLSK